MGGGLGLSFRSGFVCLRRWHLASERHGLHRGSLLSEATVYTESSGLLESRVSYHVISRLPLGHAQMCKLV